MRILENMVLKTKLFSAFRQPAKRIIHTDKSVVGGKRSAGSGILKNWMSTDIIPKTAAPV